MFEKELTFHGSILDPQRPGSSHSRVGPLLFGPVMLPSGQHRGPFVGSAEQIKEVCKPNAGELKKEGKTQTEIGKLLGVAQNTVSNWIGDSKRNDGPRANVSPDCRVTVPRRLDFQAAGG